MEQTQFNILVTNVSAIVSQTYAIQCGEFTTAMVAEDPDQFSDVSFDKKELLENTDYQKLLNGGYESINELSDQLSRAWQEIDQPILESINEKLPDNLPELTRKLSDKEFKQWLNYAIGAADSENPFYALHYFLVSFFRGNLEDNDINDAIREAIASDSVDELDESAVKPEHILMDDLITAATIESFVTFEWLIKRTRLSVVEIAELLHNISDNIYTLRHVYDILDSDSELSSTIQEVAKKNQYEQLLDFLKSTQ